MDGSESGFSGTLGRMMSSPGGGHMSGAPLPIGSARSQKCATLMRLLGWQRLRDRAEQCIHKSHAYAWRPYHPDLPAKACDVYLMSIWKHRRRGVDSSDVTLAIGSLEGIGLREMYGKSGGTDT